MLLRDAVAALSDPDNAEQLKQLDSALRTSPSGDPEDLDAMFRLFEQHPNSDGFGVFWSALHWLEAQPSGLYEHALLNSLQRKPVPFTLIMVNRMLNAGLKQAAGVSLLQLLHGVASDASAGAAAEASTILARHTSGTGQSA